MGLAIDIILVGIFETGIYFNVIDYLLVLAHAAFPAASIDVTGRTTLDIGIGTGSKA